MIISFTVRNYKSIKEETTLHFGVDNLDGVNPKNIAYPDKAQKYPVLRSAGIWGANASGKSNLLNALEALQDIVASSHRYELDEPIDEYIPFKLDSDSASAPIFFELEFFGYDQLLYIYSIEFVRNKIIAESLYFYPGAKPAKLFDRKIDTEQSSWFGAKLSGAKVMPCLDNRSYLSVAAQNPNISDQLKNVIRFFRNNINIFSPNHQMRFSAKILKEDSYRKSLTSLLACSDTGITGVNLKEEDIDINGLPENMPEKFKHRIINDFRFQPVFKHHNSLEDFSIDEESAGTRRMYDLAPMILKGLSMSNIWVLDEIDCRLHPRIVELIIRLFHDSVINGKNPQLIFTSHNTALMNSDLFRRDQIWFVQKENSGATNLTCLDEYNSEQVRANTNFEKWYRDGRFDAIPEIQYATLRSTIKDMAEKESDGESSNE